MDKNVDAPITTTGAAGFLEWLKRYQPLFYGKLKDKIPPGTIGMGALSDGATGDTAANTTTASPSFMDSMSSILTGLGTAYLTKTQVDAQQQLWNVQLQRAQAGLAPLNINPTQYGLPGPTVGVGLSADTQKFLLYAGIGLAAVLLLPKLLGSRA